MASVMMILKVNYDAIKNFINSFRGQETATQQTIQKLTKVIEQLRGGDWIGEGATAFFNEMDSEVIPAMKKLQNVMAEGDRVSKEIENIQHETENSILSLFKEIESKFESAAS